MIKQAKVSNREQEQANTYNDDKDAFNVDMLMERKLQEIEPTIDGKSQEMQDQSKEFSDQNSISVEDLEENVTEQEQPAELYEEKNDLRFFSSPYLQEDLDVIPEVL